MFLPYFVAYMVVGLALSTGVFLWAVNRGQFQDQQRARFLPLDGSAAAAPSKLSRRGLIETCGLFALVCCGLGCSAAVIIFALTHSR
jgi:nitrogen fixation-related uncharacterized protein